MFDLLPNKTSNKAKVKDNSSETEGFVADEDGSFTILALCLFLCLIIVTGIGVDVMNYENDRVKLQSTLDNAVLAAANLDQEMPPREVVAAYLDVNGLSDYDTSIDVQEAYLDRTVSAALSSEFETNFMRLSGVDTIGMNVAAAASESAPNTEISLVLDISGSMGTNNRVELMQAAANAFIDESLSRNTNQNTGQATENQTSINVVPFAGQTNPGATMFEYLGGVRFGTTEEENYFEEWEGEWAQDISNVVYWYDTDAPGAEGYGDTDYSVKVDNYPDNDVALIEKNDIDSYFHYVDQYIKMTVPGMEVREHARLLGASVKGGKQTTTFYSITGEQITGSTKFNNVDYTVEFNDFYAYVETIPNNVSSCLEIEYSDFLNTELPTASNEQVPYFVNWDYDETTQNWGWCPDDEMSIRYAQNDVNSLNSFINNLRLFDGTGTNYSLKYALALLDPAARPAFAHLAAVGEVPAEFANRPLDWSAANTSKYIVLMTDGRTSPQVRPTDEMDEENGTTELVARPNDDTTVTSSQLTNLQLFMAQCEMAKAKGVVIYTVAFEVSSSVAAEIKACASSPSHFYEVTGEEVIDSFVSIAGSIQRLRLIR